MSGRYREPWINFLNPADYNRMASAIRYSRMKYQYFEGMAFTTDWTKVEQDIKSETINAINMLWDYPKTWGKSGLEGNKELGIFLKKKIDEYTIKEDTIYHDLLKAASKNIEWVPTRILNSKTMDIKEQIACWDELIIGPVASTLLKKRDEIVDLGEEPNAALYCFLMSEELYDFLKISGPISMVLSRKQWEIGFYGSSSRYDNDRKDLEKEMLEMFKMDRNQGKGKSIREAIYNGFSAALDELPSITRQDKKKYLDIINNSYGKMKTRVLGYTQDVYNYELIHDEIRKWGRDTFEELNKKLSKENKGQLSKVEIKANQVVFFYIRSNPEAQNLVSNLKNGIEQFIEKQRASNEFPLTVLPYSKKLFSQKTATAALNKWKGYNINAAIRNFLDKNKNIEKLKSSAILSGILGELAAFLSFEKFNVETILTGQKNQYYGIFKKKNEGVSFVDEKANFGTNPNNLKSTGQFFSDMSVRTNGNFFGVNIKRYITDKNTFKLVSVQKNGLNLTNNILRRYLSYEEIKLLTFIQMNYKILDDYGYSYPCFPWTVNEIAKSVMDKNLLSILRITGAEFDIVNYLIFANGHVIPASAILKYAYQKLVSEGYKLYEITNSAPFDYVKYGTWTTREATGYYSPIETKDGTIQQKRKEFYTKENPFPDGNVDYGFLDVKNLMGDQVLERNKSITYRFNDFKISIKQLLSL